MTKAKELAKKVKQWQMLSIVLGIVLLISLYYNIVPGDAPVAEAPTESGETEVKAPVTLSGEGNPKGSESATVTIIEYSDFECPFCGRFYSQSYKRIIQDYVDTGKVRYEFRHFPLSFHPDAQKASEAAECAGDQGAFWKMHDKLFENQKALSVTDLKKYASDLGLDTAIFDTCLDSGKHAATVKADFDAGAAKGVRGTPAFYVNDQFISGAQPYSVFQQAIEAELAK